MSKPPIDLSKTFTVARRGKAIIEKRRDKGG